MEKSYYERRLNKLYNLIKTTENKERAYRLKDFESIKDYLLSLLLKTNKLFIRCENYPQDYILDRLNVIIMGEDYCEKDIDKLNEYSYARRHILSTWQGVSKLLLVLLTNTDKRGAYESKKFGKGC